MKNHWRHTSVNNAESNAADIKQMLKKISQHNYEFEDLFTRIVRKDILHNYSKHMFEFDWKANDNERKGLKLLSSILKYQGTRKFREKRENRNANSVFGHSFNECLNEYKEK